eukprot:1430862-Rhodomonas_salina.1
MPSEPAPRAPLITACPSNAWPSRSARSCLTLRVNSGCSLAACVPALFDCSSCARNAAACC